ncbi:MAG TPA: I78 family peptidase inhibitor, partial [Luteimonas sp.]|nr:I78 family peptidase inhibitor [Luteimonas sp.]
REAAGAGSMRVLRPGQAVTMEFNPTRLNLDVDAAGRVTAARCG